MQKYSKQSISLGRIWYSINLSTNDCKEIAMFAETLWLADVFVHICHNWKDAIRVICRKKADGGMIIQDFYKNSRGFDQWMLK